MAGEFFLSESDKPLEIERLIKIAKSCGIEEEKMMEAAKKVHRLSLEEQTHISLQPQAAAMAVESILSERTAFMDRLQQIANLTQKL